MKCLEWHVVHSGSCIELFLGGIRINGDTDVRGEVGLFTESTQKTITTVHFALTVVFGFMEAL